MIPGVNPRQMQQAMRKMGLQQEELEVAQVIFRMGDKELVFDNPQVSKVNMMGQETYQIIGEERTESLDSAPEISDEDIQTVIQQADCTEEEARNAIEEAEGDLAQAIIKLKE